MNRPNPLPHVWEFSCVGGAVRGFRSRSCQAFSLVEAMFAVAIAAIAIISTLSLLTFTRIENAMEQERSRAHQIICEEMERVRLDLFTRITPGTNLTVWDNGTPADTTDDTDGTLEVIITDLSGVQIFAPPNPAEAIAVEITLTWNARGSMAAKTMRESVMSYISP